MHEWYQASHNKSWDTLNSQSCILYLVSCVNYLSNNPPHPHLLPLTPSSTPPPQALVVRWYFEQREDWVRRSPEGGFMFGGWEGESSSMEGFASIVWGSPVSGSDQNTEQNQFFTPVSVTTRARSRIHSSLRY